MASWTQTDNLPAPKCTFSVTGMPGAPVFQEVIGLEAETPIPDYRTSGSTLLAPTRMPGLSTVRGATFNRGIFSQQSALLSWVNSIKMCTVGRCTIIVTLHDDSGTPKMIWTLNDAFPTMVKGLYVISGTEVAVDSVEVLYQTLTVRTA